MRFSALHIDWQLILPVFILLFVSLTTLFSINVDLFKAQLFFILLSMIVCFIVSQVNFKEMLFYKIPLYVISLAILFVVLLIGFQSRGAVRWLDILGFRIQFSEILKPFLALSFASFLSEKKNTTLQTFAQVFLFLIPIVFLIYRQPDLGNAIIYFLTVMLVLLFYGFSFRWFVAGVVCIGALVPIIWKFLHQYQQQRLLTFFHIANDPLGISYNAIQSIIAVGSGLFLGRGIGQGTQSGLRFLPERHTDFIFATASEELGFVGSVIILIASCFLLYRLYVLFVNNTNVFAKLFIAATFSLLFLQFFINAGMNIGLLPIVGITLPFVSYGGSSLLSNAIFLGLILAIERSTVVKKQVLEIT